MATVDNNNDINVDSATGNEVNNDGDGATGDDNDNDNDDDGDHDDNTPRSSYIQRVTPFSEELQI